MHMQIHGFVLETEKQQIDTLKMDISQEIAEALAELGEKRKEVKVLREALEKR